MQCRPGGMFPRCTPYSCGLQSRMFGEWALWVRLDADVPRSETARPVVRPVHRPFAPLVPLFTATNGEWSSSALSVEGSNTSPALVDQYLPLSPSWPRQRCMRYHTVTYSSSHVMYPECLSLQRVFTAAGNHVLDCTFTYFIKQPMPRKWSDTLLLT